jgi:hypothetical protein
MKQQLSIIRRRTVLAPEVRLQQAITAAATAAGVSTAGTVALNAWLLAQPGWSLAKDAVVSARHTVPLLWMILEYQRLPSAQRQLTAPPKAT